MTRIPSLRLLAAGATLVVAGLAVPLTPAVAAEPTPAPSGAATVSVTVPTATPTSVLQADAVAAIRDDGTVLSTTEAPTLTAGDAFAVCWGFQNADALVGTWTGFLSTSVPFSATAGATIGDPVEVAAGESLGTLCLAVVLLETEAGEFTLSAVRESAGGQQHIEPAFHFRTTASGPSPSDGPSGGPGGTTTTGGTTARGSASSGSSGSAQSAAQQVATGPTEPAIGKSPSTTAEQASVDKTAYNAGDTITVSFSGFTPNEKVQLVLYSDPVLIGNFPADAAGTLTQSFQLPSDRPAGAHTVQLTGWESKKVASASIVVASAATAAAPDVQGVPVWAWWIGGALLAVLAAFGTWWLIRTMRAPAPEASAA